MTTLIQQWLSAKEAQKAWQEEERKLRLLVTTTLMPNHHIGTSNVKLEEGTLSATTSLEHKATADYYTALPILEALAELLETDIYSLTRGTDDYGTKSLFELTLKVRTPVFNALPDAAKVVLAPIIETKETSLSLTLKPRK